MTQQTVYGFEELSDDLPRPPLAALRALLHCGLILSPLGWQTLTPESRQAIALEGTRGIVDRTAVKTLVERTPPKYLKLVSTSTDPDPDQVPATITKALGPPRPLNVQEWRTLRAVDRYVLASLAGNSRLLCRAYDELMSKMGRVTRPEEKWSGAIAHCELQLQTSVISQLRSPRLVDGRALMLARVAGIRAARQVSSTLDLHAESATGLVELECCLQPDRQVVLWQGHVSSWDGTFFPAASLIAVTTASAALYDMIKDLDPFAKILDAGIREEAWLVGNQGTREDEATSVYTGSVPSSRSPAIGGKRENAVGVSTRVWLPSDGVPSAAELAPPVSSPAPSPVKPSPPAPKPSAKGQSSPAFRAVNDLPPTSSATSQQLSNNGEAPGPNISQSTSKAVRLASADADVDIEPFLRKSPKNMVVVMLAAAAFLLALAVFVYVLTGAGR